MLQSPQITNPLRQFDLSKPLSAAPARQQRMMLGLQKYDSTVHHKSRKEIPVADTLSRLHLNEVDDTHEAFDAQVQLVVTNLPVSDQEMLDLQASTASAPDMQRGQISETVVHHQ